MRTRATTFVDAGGAPLAELGRGPYARPDMADLDDTSVRVLVRLGVLLCLISALACVWELLALQMPLSPFHVGVLSGPIAQLRAFSFGLGLGALALSLWWKALFGDNAGRLWLSVLVSATLLQVIALMYAAVRGIIGVQLLDPRADARFVAYARVLSHALLSAGLLTLLVRALRPAAKP